MTIKITRIKQRSESLHCYVIFKLEKICINVKTHLTDATFWVLYFFLKRCSAALFLLLDIHASQISLFTRNIPLLPRFQHFARFQWVQTMRTWGCFHIFFIFPILVFPGWREASRCMSHQVIRQCHQCVAPLSAWISGCWQFARAERNIWLTHWLWRFGSAHFSCDN